MTLSIGMPAADDASAELRPIIGRSWVRSTACGVSRESELRLPYDDDIDDDSRFIRAAQPVLERLITTMSDTRYTLVLADPEARLIHRWMGTKSLQGSLDNASIAPGFGFAEEHAGTNAVGTALEEARVVTVTGLEHFTGGLHPFACVGVPIRNLVRGSVEGILDFSCLAEDFNPLMTSLLVEVAKHIETRLTQQVSASEVALLECFVRSCRRHRGPVVGLRQNMFLSNAVAAEQINATDQTVLWDVASTYAKRGHSEGVVELSCGRYSFRMDLGAGRTKADGGVVFKLRPETVVQPPRTLPGRPRPTVARPVSRSVSLGVKSSCAGQGTSSRSSQPKSGRSPQWKKLLDRMAALAQVWEPVAFTGDDGSGKLWAAKRLVAMRGGGVRILDAELERGAWQSTLIDRCRSGLAAGESVIVRRIDRLTVPVRAELGDLVRNADEAMRLVVTCTDDPRDTVVRALAGFAHQLWIPPLAQRLDDIADIVPQLLLELAPDRVVTCALPAQQVLMRYSWPGNVTELRDVLATALVEAKVGQIEVADLPAWLLKRAHRLQLTPFEQSERDLIIATLASVDNNRAEAARVLGIGRATLYRKLRALGIPNGPDLAL
ncbi:MAG: helix-turn-helix domain-containing protein [Rhodococcus sp. (in: high G+C Gram-positive bacteria)]|uniref:sigma-54-dependent Fis family transcriptional regulator n=1 Tax=Rhodococcus sp. TaxID=1831 RepID=UPI003BB0EDA6